MPICRLPPLLVNQIAAGEVIERPASVVKELLENSIDAAATRIDVRIENGGRDLIRVSDDGHGIECDELALAVAPHATSKIQRAEDLEAIATLGFRGEALASIASVSRLSVLSRVEGRDASGLIEVEGGRVSEVRPASGAVGTTVTVANLFFNTPARRKFLRTDQTEAGRASDIVGNVALAHPGVGFRLQVEERVTLELPPGQTAPARAVEILGTELAEELLEVESSERGIRLWGLMGRPSIARGSTRHQRIFLNGRIITDRSISHAIKEAYRGLIDPGRHPTIVLFIEMDPASVDVNVHPTKAEVRFRHQGSMHGVVLSALRACLRRADLVPGLDLRPTAAHMATPAIPPAPLPEFGPSGQPSGATGAAAPATAASSDFVEYFRRLDPRQKGFVYSEVKQALVDEAPEILEAEHDVQRAPSIRPGDAEGLPTVRQAPGVLQVHSTYIITEDEQGLLIIDQHALHERVMFERLLERVARGRLESQRLLTPATIEVDPAQMDQLAALQPLLTRIGIEAEPIGPTVIAVHAFTSLLFERRVDPVEFMSELLERAAGQGRIEESEAALHEVLDMMACKAAVKAGDRLSSAELAELLRSRAAVERSSNCPHGRPTSLRLSIADLEKQFGRR